MYSEKEIEEVFKSIIKDIEDGQSLRQSLKGSDRPSSQTFYIWLDNDETKSKQYARATELRADSLVDDMLNIADNQEGDVYTDEEGIERTNHNVINRSRLRVDARKWLASKLKPKKYGDSSLLKIADNDGDKLKINAIFAKDILNVPTNDSTKEDS